MNQVVLVGRIVKINENNQEEKKGASLTIAVARPYKNSDGVYENDFINCNLFNNIASATTEYCRVGDVIGVKGRLQTNDNGLTVMAERVTFLNAHKDVEDTKENEKLEYEK